MHYQYFLQVMFLLVCLKKKLLAITFITDRLAYNFWQPFVNKLVLLTWTRQGGEKEAYILDWSHCCTLLADWFLFSQEKTFILSYFKTHTRK